MKSCLNTIDNGYCEQKLVANEPWVECAPRPTIDHVPADNWQSDPMNPAVCWRTKTAQELDAEKSSKVENRWRDDPHNDKLMMLLYTIDERLRVLEGKASRDKPTFWNVIRNFLSNNTFFDF